MSWNERDDRRAVSKRTDLGSVSYAIVESVAVERIHRPFEVCAMKTVSEESEDGRGWKASTGSLRTHSFTYLLSALFQLALKGFVTHLD